MKFSKIRKGILIPIAALGFSTASFSTASFAGTVDLSLTPLEDIAFLTGSNRGDRVLISQDTSGVVSIEGRRNTVIRFNGVEQNRVELPTSVGRLNMSLLGGQDIAIFRNVTSIPNLRTFMGRGHDKLRFFRSSFDQGTINGGPGRDLLTGDITSLSAPSDFEMQRIGSSVLTETTGAIAGGQQIRLTSGQGIFSGNLRSTQRYIAPAVLPVRLTIDDFVSESNATLFGEPVPEDVLDLSAIDANVNVPGNQAFTLVGALTGVAGQLVVPRANLFNGTVRTQSISGDVDGDGVADFTISMFASLRKYLAGPWGNNIIR